MYAKVTSGQLQGERVFRIADKPGLISESFTILDRAVDLHPSVEVSASEEVPKTKKKSVVESYLPARRAGPEQNNMLEEIGQLGQLGQLGPEQQKKIMEAMERLGPEERQKMIDAMQQSGSGMQSRSKFGAREAPAEAHATREYI